MNPLVKRPAPVLRWWALRRGSVKLANQRGRGTLIALSNYRGPLLSHGRQRLYFRRLSPGNDRLVTADCLPATIGW